MSAHHVAPTASTLRTRPRYPLHRVPLLAERRSSPSRLFAIGRVRVIFPNCAARSMSHAFDQNIAGGLGIRPIGWTKILLSEQP